jgi:hypothetical protein
VFSKVALLKINCEKVFDLAEADSQIIVEINRLLQTRPSPILVALDGGSGAGKSTLAAILEQQVDCVVVQIDDFYSADIPDWEWDFRSIAERARDVFEWQRCGRFTPRWNLCAESRMDREATSICDYS